MTGRQSIHLQGKGQAFLEMGCHALFILFWSASSGHGHP